MAKNKETGKSTQWISRKTFLTGEDLVKKKSFNSLFSSLLTKIALLSEILYWSYLYCNAIHIEIVMENHITCEVFNCSCDHMRIDQWRFFSNINNPMLKLIADVSALSWRHSILIPPFDGLIEEILFIRKTKRTNGLDSRSHSVDYVGETSRLHLLLII